MEAMETKMETALQEARAEGEFRGQVLTKMQDIQSMLKDVKERASSQEAVLASKASRDDIKEIWDAVKHVQDTKASRNDLAEAIKDIRGLQRMAYLAMGALAVVQILIAYFFD